MVYCLVRAVSWEEFRWFELLSLVFVFWLDTPDIAYLYCRLLGLYN